MTSVRINLLPPEVAQRARRRRLGVAVGGLLVVYVLLLAALYVVKLGQVNQARAERDDAQAEVTRLESEVAALGPFRALDQQLDQRNAILAQAMAEEVSMAGLLNELALVFPSTSSLRSLGVALERGLEEEAPPAADPSVPAPPPPAPTVPDETTLIGNVTFEGYSVEEYAPGVRSVIVELRRVPAFVEPRVATAQAEEIGDTEVTSYTGDADLNASFYTQRYVNGLSVEGLR